MQTTQDNKEKRPRKLRRRPPMIFPSPQPTTAPPIQPFPRPSNIPENSYVQQLVPLRNDPEPPRVEMNQVMFQFQNQNFQPLLGGPPQDTPAVFRLRSCFQRKDLHVSFNNILMYREIEPRANRGPKPCVPTRDPVMRRKNRNWGKDIIDPDSPYCAVCHTFRRFRGWHTCPLHSNLAKWTIVPPLPKDLNAEHICHCRMGIAMSGHIFCDHCEQGGAVGEQAARMLKEVGFTPAKKADHALYFKDGYDRYMNFIAWHREKVARDQMTNAWRKIADARKAFTAEFLKAGPRAA
ncbi:hypothetical protein B0T11DRAFT_297581 [Plectosphaerella cucumerina]|uniref:Uncharacterized protein n=1 Tax=Plectosphaerella cucumerina TaxID=40658 RepID=A0A8K0TEJ7_9PEZI|nr:hypothetical protein B0T11DRAFT_297581 [Plectosphaerella cucumerina]